MLDREYLYNADNDIKSISGVDDFSYNPLRQLISDVSEKWSYDAVGNRVEEEKGTMLTRYSIASTGNRLLGKDAQSYSYDANGNMLSDGNLLAYSYDGLNRLIKVNTVNGVGLAKYSYNAYSQRVEKEVSGVKTVYIYGTDGKLLSEADGATGKVLRDYVWLNGLAFAVLQDNKVYYIHPDHLNAPLLVTDANKNIVWKASYNPFGRASMEVEQIKLNLRADGQYADEETGLYYNWNRYYNPELGRYITSDPLGLQAGVNTYIYVNGNPVNYTDPTGLCPWCAIGGAVGVWSNITSQLYQNGNDWTKLNAKEVIISGVIGAASGGLGTATYALRFSQLGNAVTNIFGNSILSGTQQLATNYVNNNQCNIMDGVADSTFTY